MTAYANRALNLLEPGKLVWEESTVPAPGPNQVLLRTMYTTLNLGTELAIFGGRFRPASWWQQNITYPRPTGWGCVGQVEAVGLGVTGFEAGQRVVADGRNATYFLTDLHPANGPQPVPPGITDEQASLWSVSRVSLHGIRVAEIMVGESVAVLGQGIIGQLALRFAAASGALPLIAVDLSAQRLALAERGGATHALAGAVEAVAEEILRLNGGRGLDCVLDVTGNAEVIAQALPLVRMRGRYIVLGSPRGVSHVDFHDNIHFGVDVLGAQWNTYPQVETPLAPWTAARNGQVYFDLVQAGRIDVEGLVSHTFSWREGPEVYQRAAGDRTQFMAVRFDWRD